MRKMIGIVLLFAGALWAQSATQPDSATPASDGGTPATVNRIYDIRDYLTQVEDYPLTPRPKLPASRPSQPSNSSVFGHPIAQPGSTQAKIDDLEKLIATLVDADTWRDNGGSSGSITDLGGKLYIEQTPEAQAKIAKLIDEVTGGANRAVGISATWLLLTQDQLAALRDPAPPETGGAIVRLDEQALRQEKAFARARVLCVNGQIVHITAGSGSIKLQLQPMLTSAKGQVMLDVLNIVGADKGDASEQFHTTAKIPLGVNVLVGGITRDAGKELYLVIRIDALK